MTCIAIDDEPLALRQLENYISKIPFLELVSTCSSAVEAKQLLNEDAVDVIFADINMPDLNGLDFVRSLASPPLVVFTTAYSEFAIDSYRVDAVDYLLKPFGLDDFRRAANKAKQRYDMMNAVVARTGNATDDDTLYLKTDYKVVRVNISSIEYVEGMSEYLKIHIDNQPKPIIVLLAMKKLEEHLPDYFMRIHRSYIVNLKKIQEVNKNRVIIDADTYLPIGDMYKEAFNNYLSTKFLGK